MDCVEFWESQGIDALDAMFSVGCPNAAGEVGGHKMIGGVVFFLQIVAAFCLIKSREQS